MFEQHLGTLYDYEIICFTVIRFRFDAQPFYTLFEGDTLSDIRMIKYGNDTSLIFAMTPIVVSLDTTSSSSRSADSNLPQQLN